MNLDDLPTLALALINNSILGNASLMELLVTAGAPLAFVIYRWLASQSTRNIHAIDAQFQDNAVTGLEHELAVTASQDKRATQNFLSALQVLFFCLGLLADFTPQSVRVPLQLKDFLFSAALLVIEFYAIALAVRNYKTYTKLSTMIRSYVRMRKAGMNETGGTN